MHFRAALTSALAGITLSLTIGSAQAEVPAGVRAEIDHLLAYVGGSGCQFFRNGTWHDAKKGRSHITDKFNFLLGRDVIKATTDFIDHAATKSSMSGEAYKVRCDGVEIASAKWLNDELARYRAGAGAASTSAATAAKAPVRVTTVSASPAKVN